MFKPSAIDLAPGYGAPPRLTPSGAEIMIKHDRKEAFNRRFAALVFYVQTADYMTVKTNRGAAVTKATSKQDASVSPK
ncbi:MAG: hypothetical protein Q7V63_00300 [Gammaproteobacteria bacterium]|nr:hypothetical protein [Gammaproteobacteria bacterium]